MSSRKLNRMSHTLSAVATQTVANKGAPNCRIYVDISTKDTGRVKIGGSCINFGATSASTKDAGRVKIGGSCINFGATSASTKQTRCVPNNSTTGI